MFESAERPDCAPLVVLGTSGAASLRRRKVPVTVGLPMARGLCHDEAGLRVRGVDGAWLPLQAQVLNRWSDGSIRWVLCDLRADIARPGQSIGSLEPASARIEPRDWIRCRADGGGVIAETGACCARFAPGGSIAASVARPGRQPQVELQLSLLGCDDEPAAVDLGAAAIEQPGALRTVVRVDGHATLSGGRRVELCLRVHLFQGLAAMRCELRLRNPHRAEHPEGQWDSGDPGSVLLRRATLSMRRPAAPAAGVRCSIAPSAAFAPMDAPFVLHQASSGGAHWYSRNHIDRERRIPLPFSGYELLSGDHFDRGRRATPIVAAGEGAEQVAVAVEHFWQNFPMMIHSDGRDLDVHVLPAAPTLHELQGGEQKTYDLWLQVGPDPVTDTPLAWARQPAIVGSTPDYYAATGAVPYLTTEASDSHRDHVALVHSAIDGPESFERKREAIDEFGWRHFGEIYGDHEAVRAPAGSGPLISHYNNQYDPVAGFACQFMRSGAPAWWAQMRELAAHVTDIDVYHTDEDKAAYNRGLFWHTIHYTDADTATHRTYPASCGHGGGPSSEHNYVTGLMLAWFMTGDERYREAALDLAHFPIRIDDGDRTVFRWLTRGDTGLATASGTLSYQGPGRGSANSLSALLDGFQLTGDRAYLDKAEQIIRRVIHPDDDIDGLDLLDAERRWFYTMFLQALGKYLDAKAERSEIDGMYAWAQSSLLHYARWMAMHDTRT